MYTCIYIQYLYQSGTKICHQTHKYFVWLDENNGTVKTVLLHIKHCYEAPLIILMKTEN